MKNVVILGAGTAGTMMANHLNKKLKKKDWNITIVDQYETHYYQPGFLFIPFDKYSEKDVVQQKEKFINKRTKYIQKKIEKIEPEKNLVLLEGKESVSYDILIIATGTKIVPAETEGMMDGWHKNIFDFYTIEGATKLRDKLKEFKGGKLVVHLKEMPIKCPVAPLEFCFLADEWLTKNGLRDKTELTYVTPLSGAFTKPRCTKELTYLFDRKNIKIEIDYDVEKIDAKNNKLISYDEREVEYDLLVTIPTNMGDDLIERSGMGDDLNFIPTDKHTLQVNGHKNIFAIGDCTNVPASKAGSVAHFQSEVLTENILLHIAGKPLKPDFDGHANCFIESGFGKGLLIDFNYEVEPVPGKFPIPIIGPMALLKESRLNHLGKMAFKWIYWNMLLRARKLPITTKMSRLGKKI